MTGPRDLTHTAAKAAVSSYRGRVLGALRERAWRLSNEADAFELKGSSEEMAMARLEANTFETAAMLVEAVPMEVQA